MRRRLRRFFSKDPLPGTGQRVFLSVDETGHLRRTLRLKAGDECLVRDGAGREARALILGYSGAGGAEIQIQELIEPVENSPLRLRVFAAVPQKGKMDFLAEKAQELGVSGLTPIETERTSLKMHGAGRERAVERWRKIAREALKQSGAAVLMEVHAPVSFTQALASIPEAETAAFFHPAAEAVSFSSWIRQKAPAAGTLNLFFGPEGGFSPAEVRAAAARGASIISLGRNILKADTAFIGVIASLRFMHS